MNGSHLLIDAKRRVLVDDGKDMPTLGDVRCGDDGRVGMLLPQFVNQMCPSANNADAFAVSAYFSKSALPMPEVAPMIMMFCLFILLVSIFLPSFNLKAHSNTDSQIVNQLVLIVILVRVKRI